MEIPMNKSLFVATALAAMLSSSLALAEDKAEAKVEREKCYGVAKAGKNDCGSKDKSHSCAGYAKKDADPNEWVYAPKGLCDKLAGGKTE
jgi:uncharacterized membrane protein